MSSQRIALDSPEFVGRLREYSRSSTYERRPLIVSPRPHRISDFLVPTNPAIPIVNPHQAPQKQAQQFTPVPHEDAKLLEHKPNLKSEPTQNHKNNKSRINILSIGLVVILFVTGGGVALLQLRTNNHVAAQVKQSSSNASNNGSDGDAPPDETKPDNLGSYVVPPTQPRFLIIPKLSVDARVRRLGVKANNELLTPNNIYDTGWYEDSAKPGDAGGAILIDGHVHGPTTPGVFYGLKTLKAGDAIQIERGDGQKFNFKVVKLQTYDADKVDMAAALTPIIPGKLGLNLITCTGSLDHTGNHYEQRLVVFATAE